MVKEIIILGGRNIQIEYEALSPEQRSLLIQDLEKKYGSPLKLSPATCPASITQGTSHSVTISGTGGVAPYTITFYVNGVARSTVPNLSSPTTTFNTVFNDPAGSYTVKGEIKDSCSPQQVVSDQCTVTIVAPCSTLINGTLTIT